MWCCPLKQPYQYICSIATSSVISVIQHFPEIWSSFHSWRIRQENQVSYFLSSELKAIKIGEKANDPSFDTQWVRVTQINQDLTRVFCRQILLHRKCLLKTFIILRNMSKRNYPVEGQVWSPFSCYDWG